jgi:hypothetical protein
MAYMRTCDQVIIDALGGTAFTGPTGVVPTSFLGTQAIPVNFVAAGTAAASQNASSDKSSALSGRVRSACDRVGNIVMGLIRE